jgi:hypothetical protein
MFIYDDSFLTEQEIKDVDALFHHRQIPWSYSNATQGNDVSHPGVVDVKTQDVPYWTAGILPSTYGYPDFVQLINKFCLKHGIQYNSMGRVKLNVTPWIEDAWTLYPHVDKSTPHYIFLYYVHDSDGDTVLYNEQFTGEKIEPPLSVMRSITPKRGAAFVVDGRHFHGITPPKAHSVRSVINANLDLSVWP